MIVGHIDPEPTLQFRAGSREIRETDVGTIPVVTKSVTIPFEPFGAKRIKYEEMSAATKVWQGVPTSRLPTRFGSGKFLSRCDTAEVAKRIGVKQAVLDEWFKQHPSWGKRMLDISSDTSEAVGDKGLGDGIQANGDGSYSCLVCAGADGDPKYIKDGRGVSGHINSKAHQAALVDTKEKVAASLGV